MPSRVAEGSPEARKILVVGGSFIGSEIAASLRMLGLEVTLVEQGDHLCRRSPPRSSRTRSRTSTASTASSCCSASRSRSSARTAAPSRAPCTASGQEIEAFLAVVGVGVEPETGFLEGSGLELDNGIVVDDHFRASVDDVYAIGDVARFDDTVAGRPRRIEHWSNANNQGTLSRADARRGRPPAYAEVAVFFTKLFDLQLQVLGDPGAGVDEVVIAARSPTAACSPSISATTGSSAPSSSVRARISWRS